MSFHLPGIHAALYMAVTGLDVYADASISPSAKIWQLGSRRHPPAEGNKQSRCMRGLGESRESTLNPAWGQLLCSMEQMLEWNPSTFTERQMLGWDYQDHSLSNLWCYKETVEEWIAKENFYLSPLCGTDFWGSFEDPTKEVRKPSWERWCDHIVVWPMAYETYRWIHLCMEERAEAETSISWLQKR